jgi:hypothetical protein
MNLAPFFFVAGVVVLGALAGYSFWQDAQRRGKLAAYAASNGWAYAAENDALTQRWQGTPFGEGSRRRARNVLTGTSRGRAFVGFDYQYDTESGNKGQRTTHHVFVAAVALPAWLPGLQVTPDNFLTRAAAAIGVGSGIELESEDFNRHFRVTANNAKFASDVLTPRTMTAMLAEAAGLAWRIEGSDIVSWGSGRLEPVTLLARLVTLCGVVDGIPEFVWHDNGYDPQVEQTPGAPPAPPKEGSAS